MIVKIQADKHPPIDRLKLQSLFCNSLDNVHLTPTGVPFDLYCRYWLERMDALLEGNERYNALVIEQTGDSFTALAAIEYSPWDSGYFGVSMAKIPLIVATGKPEQSYSDYCRLFAAVLEHCQKTGIEHLTLRVNLNDRNLIQASADHRFQIMTYEGVNCATSLPSLYPFEQSAGLCRVVPFCKEHTEVVLAIASEAGDRTKTHYHHDRRLSAEQVDRYYQTAVNNCIQGTFSDGLLIALSEGKPFGFFAFKIDRLFQKVTGKTKAHPILFSIAEAEKGRGLSYAFMGEMRRQLFSSVDCLEGSVYLHNLPMIRVLSRFEANPFHTFFVCQHRWTDIR